MYVRESTMVWNMAVIVFFCTVVLMPEYISALSRIFPTCIPRRIKLQIHLESWSEIRSCEREITSLRTNMVGFDCLVAFAAPS